MIVDSIDEMIHHIEQKHGCFPKLIATSAHQGEGRMSFNDCSEMMRKNSDQHYVLMLGTGWGMSEQLLSRTDYFLEPINGPTEYNHLSVRSALAIMLDRLN